MLYGNAFFGRGGGGEEREKEGGKKGCGRQFPHSEIKVVVTFPR